MSHFTVIVCLKSKDDLDAALAPFDENLEVEPYRDYEAGSPAGHWATSILREKAGLNPDDASLTWAEVAEAYNKHYGEEEDRLLIDDAGRAYAMSTRNKQAKWDYWRVGGRWGGYFPYRHKHEAEVIEPERSWDSPDEMKPRHCDGGPKRALDLDALRKEKADEAAKTYAEYQVAVAGTPDALPWSVFTENISPEGGYTIEQAREEYHSQPRVQAIKGTDFQWYDDPIADFGVPQALYIERQRARAVPGWAILTADGRWMEQGRMGWWAMNDATEGSKIGYWEAANAYIESLPDDAWLIAVDCHI